MLRIVKMYWKLFFIFIFFWCLLHESIAPSVITSGVFASGVSILVSHALFFQHFDLDHYHLPMRIGIPFLFGLLVNIYISTFHLIRAILSGNIKPEVVKIHTEVSNPWHQCLVSNAITMTPGTVTIDKSDKELMVLWLTPSTEDRNEQSSIIQGSFEKALLRKREADK